jgi:hypothetical protein
VRQHVLHEALPRFIWNKVQLSQLTVILAELAIGDGSVMARSLRASFIGSG